MLWFPRWGGEHTEIDTVAAQLVRWFGGGVCSPEGGKCVGDGEDGTESRGGADRGELLGADGGEVDLVVEDVGVGGWGGCGKQAQGAGVGACAEGYDLPGGAGCRGEEVVDDGVYGCGAGVGPWRAVNGVFGFGLGFWLGMGVLTRVGVTSIDDG